MAFVLYTVLEIRNYYRMTSASDKNMTLLISLKQFSVDGNVSATDSHINKFLYFDGDSHHSKLELVRVLSHEMLHSPIVSQVHISDC